MTLRASPASRMKGRDSSGAERTVLLDVDGALLIRDVGLVTSHNYFPDGAVSDDALIDINNTLADALLWKRRGATETIALAEISEGLNAVSCEMTGEWGEGITVADWGNLYGGGALSPGHYSVGVSVKADDAATLAAQGAGITSLSGDYSEAYQPFTVFRVYGDWVRIVLPIFVVAEAYVGLECYTRQMDYPDAVTSPVTTIYFTKLMITEGDSAVFRDGDSDGWSWSGTPYASTSYGPPP